MAATTPHYEKGSESKIAVVLSCPGQEEEKNNKPAAGQTGKNLEDVLKILRDTYQLNDFERGKITITNAWDKVEYAGKTENKPKRTQADDNEILQEENLNRLADEIKDITDFILCGGDKAKLAVLELQKQKKLHPDCGILNLPHLGNLGMNKTIKEDINSNIIPYYKYSSDKPIDDKRSLKRISADSRVSRLEVVATEIYEQIEYQKEIKEEIDDWIERVSKLYADINKWLEEDTSYTTDKKIGVYLYEKLMADNYIQPRQLDVLDIYYDDGLIATVKPTGLWLIGSNGRVDILSKKGCVSLFDKAESKELPNWLAYPKDRDSPIPFKKEFFLTMLKDLNLREQKYEHI